jgi:hypothetical protein
MGAMYGIDLGLDLSMGDQSIRGRNTDSTPERRSPKRQKVAPMSSKEGEEFLSYLKSLAVKAFVWVSLTCILSFTVHYAFILMIPVGFLSYAVYSNIAYERGRTYRGNE